MKPLALFLLLLASLLAKAGTDVFLAWDPPVTNFGIVGTKIYYSHFSTNPAVIGADQTNLVFGGTTATVSNVLPGFAYFQATSLNVNGIESVPSNTAVYTNRFFSPINLRITGSTNNTSEIWIENMATNMLVQWSSNLRDWNTWVALQSPDPAAPITTSMFIAGISPSGAQFFRAVSLAALNPEILKGIRMPPLPPKIN